MGYVSIDLLGERFSKRGLRGLGQIFSPRTGWHIKWHPTPGDTGVVDRFHVKNEQADKSLYYLISRSSGLTYATPGPSGRQCDRETAFRIAGNPGDAKTFDDLAWNFLSQIWDDIGDRAVVSAEVKEQRKDTEDLVEKGTANIAVIRDLKRRWTELGEEPPQLSISARDNEIKAYTTVLEAAERKKRGADERNVTPLPTPPLIVDTPPKPTAASLMMMRHMGWGKPSSKEKKDERKPDDSRGGGLKRHPGDERDDDGPERKRPRPDNPGT